MSKIRHCCICNSAVFGIAAILLIVFAFFSQGVLQGVLISQAKEGVVLTPETYEQWGQIPGSTNTFVYKNFSFFNFMNAEGFAYFNETAKFVETPSFNYQEYQNFSNANYSKPNAAGKPTEVSYFYQLYNLPLNTTDDSQTRTIVNLGPMGVWYAIKTITDDFIGINAFAQLQGGLVGSLYSSILAQGILGLNMQNQSDCNDLLSKVTPPLTTAQMNAIWSDPLYGMGNQDTFPIWTQAARETNTSGTANFLRDYFQLSLQQISIILGNTMQGWIKNLDGILSNFWNCPTTPCDPNFLAALQWSQQGITANPPPPGNATPSIVSSNATAVGYPEISYYLKENLLKNNFTGNVSLYSNLTFSIELGLQVLNATPTYPYKYCNTQQSLLNLLNYQFVLNTGQKFLQNGGSLNNLTDLEPIAARWNLSSNEHAYVFYRYCEYFVSDFALLRHMNGTKGFVGLGTFAAQVLYQNFVALQHFLFVDYLARTVQVSIKSDSVNCTELMNNSLGGVSSDVAQKICSIDSIKNYDLEAMKYLTTVCRYEQSVNYNDFLNKTGLKKQDVIALCQNAVPRSFAIYYVNNQQTLNQFYNCSNMTNSCSDFEFAAKQWGSSSITLSLPPILMNQFPVNSSDTVSDFYPTVFPKRFEYVSALNYLKPNFKDENITALSYNRTLKMLNFLSMYSATILQRAFIFSKNGDLDSFAKLLNISNPVPILTYFRYLTIEFAFQGLAQTRTANALLWGYRDPFLAQVANTSVLAGGDPSTQPDLSLAGQNSTLEDAQKYFQQTVFTGADDPAKVKVFTELQGLPYINFNNTYFDGLEVKQNFTTPWTENITLYGTDASMNPQNLTENSTISVYVNDMFFAGSTTCSGETLDIQGLKTFKFAINNHTIAKKSVNPDNAKYYFDRYDGVINITSTKRAPLFFTKQYFLDADWDLVTAVELYNDTAMSQRIWPSRDKDLAIYVEPTTGAALRADQRLQLNMFFDQDELFPNIKPSMLPLFYIFRGYEFSEKAVNDLFLPLKIGLYLMNHGIWIFCVMGVIILLLAVCCGFACRARGKEPEKAWYAASHDEEMVNQGTDVALLHNDKNNVSGHQI